MSRESLLDEQFAAAYVPLAKAAYDWMTFPQWFPDLLTITDEPGRFELEFKMASDRPLDDVELKAIGSVLDGVATSDSDPDGGCDSCGYGARVWVTVTRNRP